MTPDRPPAPSASLPTISPAEPPPAPRSGPSPVPHVVPRPALEPLAGLLRARMPAGGEGALWAALLEHDRLRLAVPLRERPPAARDEDAEDRALLALLDAVGVPDVVLAISRRSGRPLAADDRLWRRARSGAVGLRVRLLGLVVVGQRSAAWADG